MELLVFLVSIHFGYFYESVYNLFFIYYLWKLSQKVGWVECNETQHSDFVGLRYANPTYILAFTTASFGIGGSCIVAGKVPGVSLTMRIWSRLAK